MTIKQQLAVNSKSHTVGAYLTRLERLMARSTGERLLALNRVAMDMLAGRN